MWHMHASHYRYEGRASWKGFPWRRWTYDRSWHLWHLYLWFIPTMTWSQSYSWHSYSMTAIRCSLLGPVVYMVYGWATSSGIYIKRVPAWVKGCPFLQNTWEKAYSSLKKWRLQYNFNYYKFNLCPTSWCPSNLSYYYNFIYLLPRQYLIEFQWIFL